MLLKVVPFYQEVDQSKFPSSHFAQGSVFPGSTVSCMPFPGNTSVICNKLFFFHNLRFNLAVHLKISSFWPILVIEFLLLLYLRSLCRLLFQFKPSIVKSYLHCLLLYLPYYMYGLLNLFYMEFIQSIIAHYSCNYRL